MAAGKAIRTKDVAFLYYAGQIRAAVDMQVYEPIGTGGNSPATLLGATKATIGPIINPAIMRDRDAFARVVARLANWTPKFEAGYEPGWEYKAALSGPRIEAAVKEAKEAVVPHLQSLNQLLHDDDYYKAFKTVQDYNLRDVEEFGTAPQSGQPKAAPVKVTRADYTAAMDRLQQIEKARGLKSGIFPDKDEWKKSRKTSYKVLADRVTYYDHDVAGADAATFKVLGLDVDYGKDARHVYVMGHAIPNADPATFRILDGLYARDKSRIYSGNVVMKVDNIDHFEIVYASGGSTELGPFQLGPRFLLETGMTLQSVRLSADNSPVTAEVRAKAASGISSSFCQREYDL